MRPENPLAHAKHIVRAALLLVVAVVVLVLGRSAFVPESWGQYGSYRAANVEEQAALTPRHGGNAACAECHDDMVAEVGAGVHASLACESCHAPLADHVQGDELVAEMPIRRTAELCLLCHAKLEGRPASHPQIVERVHLTENGGEPGEESCFECHEAHSPL